MDGIQPTYNLADRGYDGFGGGSSGLWLFAILALMNGGFGAWGARGYGLDSRAATVEDLNNSANFTRLESQVQGNGQAITQGFTNLGNGISQLGYQLATDFGDMSKEMSECCCATQRAIDAVKYEGAINTSALQAAIAADGQKTRELISQNKIEALQSQINKLELQQALCGVPRVNPYGYGIYAYPPFTGACPTAGNI